MKFLIQHNLIATSSLEKIAKAVERFPHQFCGVIPFSHEITSEDSLDNDYIPYGSTLLTMISLSKYWSGLHYNPSTFTYRSARMNRHDMLNTEYIVSIEDAIPLLRSMDGDIFIRPSNDLKQFSGIVINAKECADWLTDAVGCDSSGSYRLDTWTEVVISFPTNIYGEWRFFIVGRRIISGSKYRANGQLIQTRVTDRGMINEAQEIADIWLPDDCCVMDLALADGPSEGIANIKVVEFNCINSSGFYDHDIDAVFAALYEYHTE